MFQPVDQQIGLIRPIRNGLHRTNFRVKVFRRTSNFYVLLYF